MTPEQLSLLQEWHRAKQQLAHWETVERSLRVAVVKSFFGEYGDGTRRLDIGNGYQLSNNNTTRHDITDSPAMRQLVRNFIDYDATAKVGVALIKDKPRLSLRAFKALPAWGVKLMQEHITSTPQLPQTSITFVGD